MRTAVLEMPLATTSDDLSSSVVDQTAPALDQRGASLMTPLGLTAGEVLAEVESLGAMTLRQLIRKLDWPVYLVTMAVGVLVRQGLVRATQRELEVIVEPIPEWSGTARDRAIVPEV